METLIVFINIYETYKFLKILNCSNMKHLKSFVIDFLEF